MLLIMTLLSYANLYLIVCALTLAKTKANALTDKMLEQIKNRYKAHPEI